MPIKAIENLPVIDAKRPVALRITADDVRRADPKRPDECAAARACRRDLHAIEARVHLSRIYVRTTKDKWTRYSTPAALRSEIIAFDRGGAFAPGQYTLSPLKPSSRVVGQQGSGTNQRQKNRSQKKRRRYHVITDVRIGPA